mmetsp:Transcript_168655/g.541949  ORF Transcript_168655/g.541949 Transcript_168655/m.541949 type:complete len:647 (+) Transcript_168655:108-2048(+)
MAAYQASAAYAPASGRHHLYAHVGPASMPPPSDVIDPSCRRWLSHDAPCAGRPSVGFSALYLSFPSDGPPTGSAGAPLSPPPPSAKASALPLSARVAAPRLTGTGWGVASAGLHATMPALVPMLHSARGFEPPPRALSKTYAAAPLPRELSTTYATPASVASKTTQRDPFSRSRASALSSTSASAALSVRCGDSAAYRGFSASCSTVISTPHAATTVTIRSPRPMSVSSTFVSPLSQSVVASGGFLREGTSSASTGAAPVTTTFVPFDPFAAFSEAQEAARSLPWQAATAQPEPRRDRPSAFLQGGGAVGQPREDSDFTEDLSAPSLAHHVPQEPGTFLQAWHDVLPPREAMPEELPLNSLSAYVLPHDAPATLNEYHQVTRQGSRMLHNQLDTSVSLASTVTRDSFESPSHQELCEGYHFEDGPRAWPGAGTPRRASPSSPPLVPQATGWSLPFSAPSCTSSRQSASGAPESTPPPRSTPASSVPPLRGLCEPPRLVISTPTSPEESSSQRACSRRTSNGVMLSPRFDLDTGDDRPPKLSGSSGPFAPGSAEAVSRRRTSSPPRPSSCEKDPYEGLHLTPLNDRPFQALSSIARQAHNSLVERLTPRGSSFRSHLAQGLGAGGAGGGVSGAGGGGGGGARMSIAW